MKNDNIKKNIINLFTNEQLDKYIEEVCKDICCGIIPNDRFFELIDKCFANEEEMINIISNEILIKDNIACLVPYKVLAGEIYEHSRFLMKKEAFEKDRDSYN